MSALLSDPGELLAYADAAAARAPLDIAALTRPELLAADDALEVAIAAVKDLLAHVPADAEGLSGAAFTTAAGRAVCDRDPGRFTRASLTTLRDALKKRTYTIVRRAGELADPVFAARNRALSDMLIKGLTTPDTAEQRARREAEEEQRRQRILAEYHATRVRRAPPTAASLASAFARVLAAPGSDAARRALLAEWEAAGDPRAALLADQLALRAHRLAGTLGAPEAQALYRKVNLAVARASRPLPPALAELVTAVEYMRGLVAGVTLPGANFPEVAARVFAAAPIQHVTFTAPLGDLRALFATLELDRVVSLNVHGLGAAFGDAGARALAASPRVAGLRWLGLTDNAIGDPGVVALAASPHLTELRFLALAGNPADVTPWASMNDGVARTGRPALAVALERAYGARPWLAEPDDAASWPPDRDELAVTP